MAGASNGADDDPGPTALPAPEAANPDVAVEARGEKGPREHHWAERRQTARFPTQGGNLRVSGSRGQCHILRARPQPVVASDTSACNGKVGTPWTPRGAPQGVAARHASFRHNIDIAVAGWRPPSSPAPPHACRAAVNPLINARPPV